jgi:hypothetical protein
VPAPRFGAQDPIVSTAPAPRFGANDPLASDGASFGHDDPVVDEHPDNPADHNVASGQIGLAVPLPLLRQGSAMFAEHVVGPVVRGIGRLGDDLINDQLRSGRTITLDPQSGAVDSQALPGGPVANPAPDPASRFTAPAGDAIVQAGHSLEIAHPNLAERSAGLLGEVGPVAAAGLVDPMLPVAIMGLQGADTADQDARAHGATDAEREAASQSNALLQAGLGGVTFGNPLTRFLAPETGAILTGALRLGEAGVVGYGTGAAMQAGENEIARETFDPNRHDAEGVNESGLSMAALSLLFHGAHAAGQLAHASEPRPTFSHADPVIEPTTTPPATGSFDVPEAPPPMPGAELVPPSETPPAPVPVPTTSRIAEPPRSAR